MDIKRVVTLRLLQLIRDMTNKATELEGVGIRLVATDEMIEGVTAAMFEINGIKSAAAGSLHLSLSDYISGDIEEHDFLGHLDRHCSVVREKEATNHHFDELIKLMPLHGRQAELL